MFVPALSIVEINVNIGVVEMRLNILCVIFQPSEKSNGQVNCKCLLDPSPPNIVLKLIQQLPNLGTQVTC